MRDLLRDRNGVGAVEFAFVAPILVILYIGAVEMTLALSVDTKVSRAGNITLDLITQGTSTSRSELSAMSDVAESVIAPYEADDTELRYTAISVSSDGTKAVIDWSWGNVTQKPYTANTEVTIPASLMVADAFYIRGEIFKTHNFITSIPFSNSNATSLNLNETYYMRPRLGTSIGCSDCND
ncbi:MAG: TadE/TadG family type IV pilus assembly protein [Pseudomonadota bacterium]